MPYGFLVISTEWSLQSNVLNKANMYDSRFSKFHKNIHIMAAHLIEKYHTRHLLANYRFEKLNNFQFKK